MLDGASRRPATLGGLFLIGDSPLERKELRGYRLKPCFFRSSNVKRSLRASLPQLASGGVKRSR